MNASVLNRTLTAYRVGAHSNAYPIFDGKGSLVSPGRWNKKYSAIYCALNYSLSLLEKLVHSNIGDIPQNQQWIEITIPTGITYETVTSYSLPNWNKPRISKQFGDRWLKSQRSCILIVPSIIAPVDNNVLINESHPQFSTIQTGLNQPVIWDKRLFFS